VTPRRRTSGCESEQSSKALSSALGRSASYLPMSHNTLMGPTVGDRRGRSPRRARRWMQGSLVCWLGGSFMNLFPVCPASCVFAQATSGNANPERHRVRISGEVFLCRHPPVRGGQRTLLNSSCVASFKDTAGQDRALKLPPPECIGSR